MKILTHCTKKLLKLWWNVWSFAFRLIFFQSVILTHFQQLLVKSNHCVFKLYTLMLRVKNLLFYEELSDFTCFFLISTQMGGVISLWLCVCVLPPWLMLPIMNTLMIFPEQSNKSTKLFMCGSPFNIKQNNVWLKCWL